MEKEEKELNIPMYKNPNAETPQLSQVNVNNTIYDIKDATARAVTDKIKYSDNASGEYTPEGTISNTTISVNPTTATVQGMKTAGTAYSITDGSISQAESGYAQFPINGMIATYDSDNDNLILEVSGKTTAITSVGAVTYTAPVLSGELPTFGEPVNVVTGVSAEFATTPVFNGTKATITVVPSTTTKFAVVDKE